MEDLQTGLLIIWYAILGGAASGLIGAVLIAAWSVGEVVYRWWRGE